jgi:hypothetical protein
MGRWNDPGNHALKGIGRLRLYRLPRRTTATLTRFARMGHP